MSEPNTRRFPPPWTVDQITGGFKVKDANGQSLRLRLWPRDASWCGYSPRAHHGRGQTHRQQHR